MKYILHLLFYCYLMVFRDFGEKNEEQIRTYVKQYISNYLSLFFVVFFFFVLVLFGFNAKNIPDPAFSLWGKVLLILIYCLGIFTFNLLRYAISKKVFNKRSIVWILCTFTDREYSISFCYFIAITFFLLPIIIIISFAYFLEYLTLIKI